MNDNAVQKVRSRIWRRIVLKSIVFALWIAGLAAVILQGPQDLPDGTYLYMIIVCIAVWAVSTVRDVRRLRDEAELRKAAIAETDERNVLITYKATRLAVVIMLCLAPLAMIILAFNGMQEEINALALGICAFLVIYLASWYIIASRS